MCTSSSISRDKSIHLLPLNFSISFKKINNLKELEHIILHKFLIAIKYEIAQVTPLPPLNPKSNSSHLLWCDFGCAPDQCLVMSMAASLLPQTSLFGVNILLHLSKNFFLSLCSIYICKFIRKLKFLKNFYLLLCIFFEMAHHQNFSNHFIIYQPPPNGQKYVIFQ